MKKYQKPVLDAVEYEVEEILTLSLVDGPQDENDNVIGGDAWFG